LRKEKEEVPQEIAKITSRIYEEVEIRRTTTAKETNKRLDLLKQDLKQRRKKQNELEDKSLTTGYLLYIQLITLAVKNAESEKKIDVARNTNEQILASMAKLKAEVLELEDTCQLQREEISAMSCCMSQAANTLQNFQSRPVYLRQRDQSVSTSRGLYRGAVHLDQHFLGSNPIRRAQRSVIDT
jgi:chromosome segregation ATPase